MLIMRMVDTEGDEPATRSWYLYIKSKAGHYADRPTAVANAPRRYRCSQIQKALSAAVPRKAEAYLGLGEDKQAFPRC